MPALRGESPQPLGHAQAVGFCPFHNGLQGRGSVALALHEA